MSLPVLIIMIILICISIYHYNCIGEQLTEVAKIHTPHAPHALKESKPIVVLIFFIDLNMNGKLISRPINDVNIRFQSSCILSHFDI